MPAGRIMRILALCHDHPGITPGGTEFQAWDLARHLDRLPGVDCRFLAVTTSLPRPDAAPGSLDRIGPDLLLHTGAYDAFTITRLDGPDWTAALARVVASHAPDLVHLHGLDRIGASVVTLLRSRFPRLRLVLTLHDYQLICAQDGLMLRAADGSPCGGAAPDACHRCFPRIAEARHALRAAHLRTILGQVDAFIAPIAFACQRHLDWGLPAARIHLIRNAMPETVVPEASLPPAEAIAGRAPSRFAYPGNLAAHKGLPQLLKAAALLRAEGSGIRITLHGDMVHPAEPDRARMEGLIAEAWPVVQHLGRYAREDVPALLAATDWVVLPAVWPENAPLAVLEALQAGKPVICAPVGGLPELVQHGVNGLHVPRGDVHALAATLGEAAADPVAWQRLAEGTRHRPRFADHLEAHRTLFSTLLQKAAA